MIVTDYEKFRAEGEARRSSSFSPATPRTPQLHMHSGAARNYSDVLTGGSKFDYGISGTGSSTTIDHQTMRQNARAATHESLQARAVVERHADVIIATGLELEPAPEAQVLGINEERAEAWADDTARRFRLWALDRRSYRDESMNFYQAQRLAGIFQNRDNDIFVRFYYSRNRDLQNPLQISFIDPDLVNGDQLTDTIGMHLVEGDGIERDARGREIAYNVHILRQNQWLLRRIPAVGRSGRRMMIHGFMPEYAGQKRGFSRIGHALQEFQKMTDFTLAQIQKAIIQSSLTMYVKPSKDAPASQPFEEQTLQYSSGPAMYSTPQPTLAGEPSVNYCDLQTAAFRRPGSVGLFTLQGGEDLKGFADSAPSESFDKFVNSFMSYLTASNGMPIEVLLMKFGQNYSASRATLLLFWQVAEIMRAELVSDFLQPVYEAWLSEEIAAGRIAAPGFSDPVMKRAWLTSNWFGSPIPNIDPLKTAQANKENLLVGAETLDRIARQHNGSSGKANRAALAREYEELPIPPWETQPASPDEATRDDEENDDE